jgi:hypothetical protein
MEEYLCLSDAQDAGKLKMQAITTILHLQSITYMHTANHAARREIERRVLKGL